jgi:hypothetical protein
MMTIKPYNDEAMPGQGFTTSHAQPFTLEEAKLLDVNTLVQGMSSRTLSEPRVVYVYVHQVLISRGIPFTQFDCTFTKDTG